MSKLIVRSPSNPRLIVVANRLPVTVKRSQDGNLEYSTSAGGLVSGMSGMSHKLSSQWYGWPGIEISEGDKKDVKDKLWRDHHAVPVWLSENLADSHYNGFSSERFTVSYCRACWQMEADTLQTQCYGHFSTIIPENSPSTKDIGRAIKR